MKRSTSHVLFKYCKRNLSCSNQELGTGSWADWRQWCCCGCSHTQGRQQGCGIWGMLQAEDGDVGLCQHSFCPGSARGELGDTRAQGPEVTQQQQLCVQPHQGSALCHVRSHQVLAAQSTFRGTGLLGFLHTSHLHACLSARVKDQPLGTHLQPGIISDLRKF